MTATAARGSSSARATERQRERLADFADPGHRTDLGDQRSNHLHRRHDHRLGRPCTKAKTRCTRPRVVGHDHRARSRWRVRLCRAAERHRRSLLNITAGTTRCSWVRSTDVAFSGDGTTVAWVGRVGAARPDCSPRARRPGGAPPSCRRPARRPRPSDVALDLPGDEARVSQHRFGEVAELVVVQLPSGTPLAVGSAVERVPAHAVSGWRPARVRLDNAGGAVDRAGRGPGRTTKPQVTQSPAAANCPCSAFVQAQVGQDGQPDFATLAALSAPGVDAASSTPQDLSRAYVISTYLDLRVASARASSSSSTRAPGTPPPASPSETLS